MAISKRKGKMLKILFFLGLQKKKKLAPKETLL
jgi:hypothetical protein